jgi:poly(3-hydroxybutyrate) depolymerase
LSIDAVAASAAARNGCTPTPAVVAVTSSVQDTRYSGCSAGHRVELWKMLGAGHTWAGPKAPLVAELGGLVVGPTNTSIDATSVALDFFSHHGTEN